MKHAQCIFTTVWRRRFIPALVLTSLLGLVSACGGEVAEGRFVVSDIQTDDDHPRQCLEEAFPMEPSFFAARERIDSAGLFMQTEAHALHTSDTVYIELYEADTIGERLGESFEISYPPPNNPPARAQLALAETCPRLQDSLAIVGTVTFSEFGIEQGDIITGRMTDASIIDIHSGDTLAEITGEWSFPVRLGLPYRYFPTHREKYPTSPDPPPEQE